MLYSLISVYRDVLFHMKFNDISNFESESETSYLCASAFAKKINRFFTVRNYIVMLSHGGNDILYFLANDRSHYNN